MLIEQYRLSQHGPKRIYATVGSEVSFDLPLLDKTDSLKYEESEHSIEMSIKRIRDGVYTHKDIKIYPTNMKLDKSITSYLGSGVYRLSCSISAGNIAKTIYIILYIVE